MFKNLYRTLAQKKHLWANEEEVRQGWVIALSNALHIDFQAERGKKDSSYNNVVIEFKSRGLFQGKETSPAFNEAINDRLKPYILKTAAAEGIDPSDYIGIAIDGDHISFAQVVDGEIEHGQLLEFSETSVSLVATACTDSFRRAVIANNLVDDFGPSSECGKALMRALGISVSKAVNSAKNNKIKMLFEEWRALYGQVADLSSDQLKSLDSSLRFTSQANKKDRISAGLFVIHTYNSLIIKLLAAEIISAHGLTSYKGFAERTATLNNDGLLEILERDIELAGLFSRAGIKGFVEEAIFSWYLDASAVSKYRPVIAKAIRDVLVKLALYRTDNLTNARSNDVLKSFYQVLVPETLRKCLGEFYTPDWLVSISLDKAEPTNWLKRRVLDPTCGSASFLLEAIRRIRAAAEKRKWDIQRIVSHLTTNVWGFDLNPLAVQTSRVNFLIAIADLLKAVPGQEVELPILLADAIYSPAKNPKNKDTIVEYRIGSSVADLTITLPASLAFDRTRLDVVFESMGRSVSADLEPKAAIAALVDAAHLSEMEAEEWGEPLSNTYTRVLILHRKNWNGIWFRIVRNFFWSATAGTFNLVVGNPPWVRWSKLPELYRERVKPTCLQYNIFSSTPHHGGNELDISAMITYTVADKWLERNGTLIFLLTQSLFQSPSSEGFRRFRISGKTRLLPKSVDDLKSLKPFPDAANKTVIGVFKKGIGNPKYPIKYIEWSAKADSTRSIPPSSTKSEVHARVNKNMLEARPVMGDGSPWAILRPGRFSMIKKLTTGTGSIQGRKGITTDLNGVYFVPVLQSNATTKLVQIETRPEAGKINIGPKQKIWIEPELLYPLIKGASDFSACYFQPKSMLYALVPNHGITKNHLTTGETRVNGLPKSKNYFETFEALLRNRATYKGRMKSAPFYSIYNVGDYSFAPFKVIWAEQSGNFCAAVASSAAVPLIGTRPFVPDHKIFFVEYTDLQAAYFLCGLLNAPLIKEYVSSHVICIQVGDIFKHMALPAYSKTNKKHVAMARTVARAHREPNETKREKIVNKAQALAEKILKAYKG